MRISLKMLAVAISFAVVPQLAIADATDDKIQQMQERMEQMEARLQAAQDQIEATERVSAQQQAMLVESGVVAERGAASGLSAFLENTEFSGFMAGSYSYNFNGYDNSGASNVLPMHPDENSFEFDQFLLEMSKSATSEDRAGFNFAIMFGRGADIASGDGSGSAGDDLWVETANIEYLTGGDILLTAGIFGTPIGAESINQRDNWNITRGLVWGLQPVQHTGVIGNKDFGNGWDFGLGLANDKDTFMAAAPDNNRSKTYIVHTGYTAENWSASLQSVYGSETPSSNTEIWGADSSGKDLLVDAVLTCDAVDNLSVWINLDYLKFDKRSTQGRAHLYAAAVAGRYAIDDLTGIALRGEYLNGDFPMGQGTNTGSASGGANTYSLTGTVDRALTDNLTLKAELRYDEAPRYGFWDDSYDETAVPNDPSERSQTVGLVELLYAF